MIAPEIAEIATAEKPALWAMYQRYARELAPMANIQPVDNEIPAPDFDDFWKKPRHWPLWASADGARIGFALIRFMPAFDAMQMSQFYIVPGHRRGGCGQAFARTLLARHPGPWRIRQMAANTSAVAFWRRVADKGLDRVEQRFMVS
ncbi:MAG TPA: GNAT family N-acetyltransferase [Rhizomicrobium sp.]|jgi:predicted acetyltransferase